MNQVKISTQSLCYCPLVITHDLSTLLSSVVQKKVSATERFHRLADAPKIDLPEVLRSGGIFFHECAKRVIPFYLRSIPMDLVGRGLTQAAG